ncbi:MAG: cobaltochelatase subunit CobN, partial [Muribaculum sp.]|nr:cobaltochelatase subunit CobN [Muribaculum sp.]
RILAGEVPNDSVTADVLKYRNLLLQSTSNEISTLLTLLDGGSVDPTPGGDPVVNPNVLPTGRNMYSINVEATPTPVSWSTGVMLAEETLDHYRKAHDGEWPEKVSYTFWAGEFIASNGATLAQVLWMLGVEPVRDSQGRVVDLQLVPSERLGRPRIDVMVQVSGQLRDIAGSRLKLVTEAVKLASESTEDRYINYVKAGSECQLSQLISAGIDKDKAERLSISRVFGPVNSGYSTGMISYTANSGCWEDRSELSQGYISNMGAIYGDDETWGNFEPEALKAALNNTAVIVQPRQSNTWGPVSLDHVYEFSGALSLAVKEVTGREPDAVMADYRNPRIARVQDTKEAIGVESNATVYNPVFIAERMKGDATTAHTFAEIFRNIYGWTVMRPSALDDNVYDRLYDIYVADNHSLGLKEWFDSINPAAYQEMTATMLEAARKGYWKPDMERLRDIAQKHAAMTEAHGPSGTEFVDGNSALRDYTASLLNPDEAARFTIALAQPINDLGVEDVKGRDNRSETGNIVSIRNNGLWIIFIAVISIGLAVGLFVILRYTRSRKNC